MKTALYLLLFLPLLSFPLFAEEQLRSEDFAGTRVYTGREGGLLVLEIPPEVFQGLRRPDLGDLRIFDESGLALPHTIRNKAPGYFTPPPRDIPFFVWEGGRENNFPAGNTDIEINTSGGIVRIRNQNNVPARSSVFLADLSSLDYPPAFLRATIEGTNFNYPLSIHYSDDLSAWRALGRSQVLAYFGSNVLNTLELPENESFNYLLLSFQREVPLLALTAFFREEEREAEYQEVTIRGTKSPDGRRINYNTGAFLPAELLDFALTETDSIPVIIKNRMSENAEWRVEARGNLFRFNSASGIVRNPPFEIANSSPSAPKGRGPFWELEAAGDLPFNEVPDLHIRWRTRELIFPARGQGPWTLAYGNHESPPLAAEVPVPAGAELSDAIFTGEYSYTERALAEIPRESNLRSYLLWSFLIAATLILLFLAYSIAKSMRK